MRVAVLVAACSVALPLAASAQTRPPVSKAAEAYAQFLIAHHLEEREDENGAIAAYKRAMELDPQAADIPAELAALYLRQSKVQEAMAAAEQALKVAPANREANRVLGIVYAALSESGRGGGAGRAAAGDRASSDNLAKAIQHLEAALERPMSQGDPNVRATLARVYVNARQYDKAIPVLTDLVSQEPGWQDGPSLLAEAYSGAGRTGDAIAWFEQHAADDPRLLPTLGDFYERERRWSDAASAYERALPRSRNADLRTRYASALINAGGRQNLTKARDVLTEMTASRAPDALASRALYLLSQAQRRLGDAAGAEASARKVIAQNSGSSLGYYALAEALEERH